MTATPAGDSRSFTSQYNFPYPHRWFLGLAQDKAAISAAEAGCGPQDKPFEVNSDELQHTAPTPEEGKAVIYFIADGHPTSVFGVDGKWVGAVNGGRYFFVSIQPGEHHLCARRQTLFHREPALASMIQALEFRSIH